MTDITKYRNVSLTHETYKKLIALSKVLLPDAKLSSYVDTLNLHMMNDGTGSFIGCMCK